MPLNRQTKESRLPRLPTRQRPAFAARSDHWVFEALGVVPVVEAPAVALGSVFVLPAVAVAVLVAAIVMVLVALVALTVPPVLG